MTAVTRIGRPQPSRFTAPGGWTVKVVSYYMPAVGPKRRPMVFQFYQVRRWGVLVKETNDVDYVRRAMGAAAFAQLTEVAP